MYCPPILHQTNRGKTHQMNGLDQLSRISRTNRQAAYSPTPYSNHFYIFYKVQFSEKTIHVIKEHWAAIEIRKEGGERDGSFPYQWMLILLATWLTTLISKRSPSLATILGPGNCPFTVTMLFVWHSLVTFCNWICPTPNATYPFTS